jgi:hypothetical protein
MAAFRRGAFAEMTLGAGTGKVMSCLDGGARSPNELGKKNRLRDRLRGEHELRVRRSGGMGRIPTTLGFLQVSRGNVRRSLLSQNLTLRGT